MVGEPELSIGRCYFFLTYHDQDLKVPDIRTVIYIGSGYAGSGVRSPGDGNGGDAHLFQDAQSYVEAGSASEASPSAECQIYRVARDDLSLVYGWADLIAELSRNFEAQRKGAVFN